MSTFDAQDALLAVEAAGHEPIAHQRVWADRSVFAVAAYRSADALLPHSERAAIVLAVRVDEDGVHIGERLSTLWATVTASQVANALDAASLLLRDEPPTTTLRPAH